MAPRVSIVIPTRNRSAVLAQCLEAVGELHCQPGEAEVLVIDNGSTDDTPRVIEEFRSRPRAMACRHLREDMFGASRARNRGVREAQGELILFLDDDSPPEPKWLEELSGVFRDPLVGCAGGPSVLDFQGQEIPWWLRGGLQGLLSGYGLPHDVPTAVTRREHYPYGCNLAVRRQLFTQLGDFRVDLDRTGDRLLAAGDSDLVDRIWNAGWKVLYVPDARVRHLVAPNRLAIAYAFRIGLGLAESHVILTSDPRWLAVARWFASDAWYSLRLFSRFAWGLLRLDRAWVDDLMRCWIVSMRIPLRVRSIGRRLWNRSEGLRSLDRPVS